MGTKIINCSCSSAFQDQRYGKGRRLANATKSGDGRCTVCSKVAIRGATVPKGERV